MIHQMYQINRVWHVCSVSPNVKRTIDTNLIRCTICTTYTKCSRCAGLIIGVRFTGYTKILKCICQMFDEYHVFQVYQAFISYINQISYTKMYQLSFKEFKQVLRSAIKTFILGEIKISGILCCTDFHNFWSNRNSGFFHY